MRISIHGRVLRKKNSSFTQITLGKKLFLEQNIMRLDRERVFFLLFLWQRSLCIPMNICDCILIAFLIAMSSSTLIVLALPSIGFCSALYLWESKEWELGWNLIYISLKSRSLSGHGQSWLYTNFLNKVYPVTLTPYSCSAIGLYKPILFRHLLNMIDDFGNAVCRRKLVR